MARSARRYQRRQNEFALLRTILLFFMLFIVIGSFTYYWQQVIKPIINDISEIKARSMITAMINDTIHDKFEDQVNVEQLLIIKMNNEGNIEFVQANTQAMNYLVSDLTKELQKRYKHAPPETVRVPLGTLMGSQLLSQAGPYVNLKVMPQSVSKTEFQTEFVTEGINQTKYKVYVNMDCQVNILAPFSDRMINVHKTVLIAEAVILGKVPSSYIVVPEDKAIEAERI